MHSEHLVGDISVKRRLFCELIGPQFREVAGRTLNTRNDMYMLPVDDEEQDRQDIEHRALYLVLDGLYAAPDLVAKAMAPRQNRQPAVFDIGTGSGIW